MVARLDEQKDHATLLRALSEIRRPWTLDLVGEGPLCEDLQSLAVQLGVRDRVRFLGLRHDVSELLRHAQLFVLASHWEGLPRSILEAMRAGLPVVATSLAGVPEVVVDGGTGTLVPHADVAALRSAIEDLLANAETRVRYGAAGRRRFIEQFTFSRMLADTLAVYDEVLAERGLPERFTFAAERVA
jgi:glycosyltransferase involved in cell wall biosynthesis